MGLHVSESLEPGHALLDLAAKMEQENQIQFIPPEKCVSRLHEVMNVKTPTKIVELEASRLVVKEESAGLEQPASSALQLQDALRRRGLALVFAQSCSWGSYEKYVCKLFGHLARDPPPGMARCSVSQPRPTGSAGCALSRWESVRASVLTAPTPLTRSWQRFWKAFGKRLRK